MMHSDHTQQNLFQNPQAQYAPQGISNLQQLAQSLLQLAQNQQGAGYAQGTIGQGAYGGAGNPLGGGSFAAGWGWGAPQRQLSQQDVSAILQQIAPVLPQIIAQAQQHQYQPMAAYGGGIGAQRTLSPQDVSEVVRQILPVIPQLMQSAQQPGGAWGLAQMGLGQFGGVGQPGQGWGQAAYGLQQNPFQQFQQPRQLTQQDVNEIARQLSEVVQQAYGGQQTGQMRFS
jgi:hypothetical protein